MNLHKLLSFEQGRIIFFETLTKHPENWQQNPTPLPIVRKMLDKTSLDNKKILVLFNIEFLQVLVEERKINPENIYYIADNDLEYLSAIKIFKVQSYKLSDFTVPALKNLIVGLDMKFDLVFSNPPYNRGMDIKILNEITNHANEIVAIHPSISMIELKGNKLYNIFKQKNIKSIDCFNGNFIFDIGLFYPCMISYIDNSHAGKIEVKWFDDIFSVEDANDVTVYSSHWKTLVKPFYQKIFKECENDNVWNHNKLSIDQTKFHCQLAAIRGHVNERDGSSMVQSDFYTCCMQDVEGNKGIRQPNLNRAGNPTPTFEFDTEIERDNFLNFINTDFARFCLSLLKNNANLAVGEMKLIPWLDFTEEWDDDKLFKKFDVSQELQDYIRDFLPDYYSIRK